MSEQEVNDAMAGGAAAFILSDKPHERDYRKTLLKRCALATMQLWSDLEQEERAGRKALA